MKRRIFLFLIAVLLMGLTACGKAPESDAMPAMTTESVEMVEVEVLTEVIHYDTDGNVVSRWEYSYDEMGRETRVVITDSEGNIQEEDTIRWNDDKSHIAEGFWYGGVQDGVETKVYMETKVDPKFGRHGVQVRYFGDEITSVEAWARDPYGEGTRWYLDIEQYKAGDWGTSGWHYSNDQDGNLICSIEYMTLDGVEQWEVKHRPNGDLLYSTLKRNGAVMGSTEISYDEKGRPVRAVYGDTQIDEWSYNDAANTGEFTRYLCDIWGEYEGLRKDCFEERVYDKNGNVVTAYGQEYDCSSQTVIETYTIVIEYDENNMRRTWRRIDAESGEVTVYTYDAHGNQILWETYNADGTLESASRADYIYTTIQVTPEAAEMYHAE